MPTLTAKLNLGSSSFISTAGGYATEHLQYMAYGEDFIHQQNTSNFYTPYTFSAKEKDAETNFSYFGARYYQADLSIWLSVDPLADKYPHQSPFMYCSGNPVMRVDPTGMEDGDIYNLKGVKIGDDGQPNNKVYLKNTTDSKVLSKSESLVHTTNLRENNTVDITAKTGLTNDELNVRATLSTIMQTEAGRSNPPLSYNSWFGSGNVFTKDSYQDNPKAYDNHPGMHENPKGSAAGAYQFLKRYYTGADMSPMSQDQAAIGLMGSIGLKMAKSGEIANFGAFASKTQKWTSFKHWPNTSLTNEFNKNRANELLDNSRLGTPVGKLLKN